MRELTFKGFLKQYVKSLSFANTNGLYKLAMEADSNNPRLREPLLLYALLSEKENVLLQAAKGSGLRSEYVGLLAQYDKHSMEVALRNNDPSLPERYIRVYKSYISVMRKPQNDNHLKQLMRDRIVRLQREKGISTYRIYTDLKLNPGSFNTFVKNGNYAKVSLDTARNVIMYLENA